MKKFEIDFKSLKKRANIAIGLVATEYARAHESLRGLTSRLLTYRLSHARNIHSGRRSSTIGEIPRCEFSFLGSYCGTASRTP
jgi:hypothetical protein